MSPRMEDVELAIEHVRERGKGMPVGRMDVSESPSDSAEGEPIGYLWILINVIPIIIADELVIECLAKS